jgi:hypothetical protein
VLLSYGVPHHPVSCVSAVATNACADTGCAATATAAPPPPTHTHPPPPPPHKNTHSPTPPTPGAADTLVSLDLERLGLQLLPLPITGLTSLTHLGLKGEMSRSVQVGCGRRGQEEGCVRHWWSWLPSRKEVGVLEKPRVLVTVAASPAVHANSMSQLWCCLVFLTPPTSPTPILSL